MPSNLLSVKLYFVISFVELCVCPFNQCTLSHANDVTVRVWFNANLFLLLIKLLIKWFLHCILCMCCWCQLEDTRLLLADQQHVHAVQSELYDKTVANLRQELDDARMQLKESKDRVAEPSSLLLHLQKELLSVKVRAAELHLLVS